MKPWWKPSASTQVFPQPWRGRSFASRGSKTNAPLFKQISRRNFSSFEIPLSRELARSSPRSGSFLVSYLSSAWRCFSGLSCSSFQAVSRCAAIGTRSRQFLRPNERVLDSILRYEKRPILALDEAFLEHLLIAEPQIRDVG